MNSKEAESPPTTKLSDSTFCLECDRISTSALAPHTEPNFGTSYSCTSKLISRRKTSRCIHKLSKALRTQWNVKILAYFSDILVALAQWERRLFSKDKIGGLRLIYKTSSACIIVRIYRDAYFTFKSANTCKQCVA